MIVTMFTAIGHVVSMAVKARGEKSKSEEALRPCFTALASALFALVGAVTCSALTLPLEFQATLNGTAFALAVAPNASEEHPALPFSAQAPPGTSVSATIAQTPTASGCNTFGCGEAIVNNRLIADAGVKGPGVISVAGAADVTVRKDPDAAAGGVTGTVGLVRWLDTFRLVGVPGTVLEYRPSVKLTGTVTTSGFASLAEIQYSLTCQFCNILALVDMTPGDPDIVWVDFELSSRDGGPPVSDVRKMGLTTIQGRHDDHIRIEEELSFRFAVAREDNGETAAIVSFAETAQFFLDPITPGASYITASGLDYSSRQQAVPEPKMWTLLLLGFAAAFVARTWRRDPGAYTA